MEKRAYTVDLLRGLAIVGMVLSGQILWHAELPAWLFHAQVPPPSFRFDPSVPGITWVDLVFPFFLFSMGAAFPLALRRRLEQRGESVALILTVVARRWALLALFAIALANLRSGVTGTLPGWGSSLLARLGVLTLLAALRLGSGVEGSWNEALWDWSPAPWLFRFDYLKYLCIIIPGTIAGDRIYEWMTQAGEDAPGASRRREVWILVLLVTLICLNMWGLFARQLVVNIAAGVLICLLLRHLLRGDGSATGRLHRSLFGWGFFWLMLGLALEAFEGGIKKDYATFSYFFVTSGLASFVLIAAGIAMRRLNVRFSALVKCGQNPMVAYTAAGFLIMPLLTLLHLAPYLQTFAGLCPWMGVVRGVLVTAAVMAVTVFFTNRRLFWRT